MSENQAGQRHGQRAHQERTGGHLHAEAGTTKAGREREEEIYSTEAKKSDMPKAVQTPFMAGVSAQPLKLVKLQPEQRAAGKPQQDPDPTHDQVGLDDSAHKHGPR